MLLKLGSINYLLNLVVSNYQKKVDTEAYKVADILKVGTLKNQNVPLKMQKYSSLTEMIGFCFFGVILCIILLKLYICYMFSIDFKVLLKAWEPKYVLKGETIL